MPARTHTYCKVGIVHKRLYSYAYMYCVLMANGICQKGLRTLHHFCACSACNSWFHVLFQMTIPMRWSIREESHICHVRAGRGQHHSSGCALVCEAMASPRSSVLVSKVRVRTRQTKTKPYHASQELDILVKLLPVSGFPFAIPSFWKVASPALPLVKYTPFTLPKPAPQ